MLTEAAALELVARHLGDSPPAAHSIQVGRLTALLAEALGADVELWRATGLCHDLDYLKTRDTPERHGPLAAAWLAGDLPPEARSAIAAHDHRAGLTDTSQLAQALRLADALAIAHELQGQALCAALRQADSEPALAPLFPERPWLATMIAVGAAELGLATPALAAMLEGA
jgi:putative nucleotidyltransferase with HDIG domain